MEIKAGTIVVGVDGSASSDRALAWAADQAAIEHRPITLVHALDAAVAAWMDPTATYPQETRDQLRAEGQTVLDQARSDVEWRHPDLEVDEVLTFADPRELLLGLSEQAALIVLGSRGLGRMRSLLLGSVGVAVVRHASCPVVVHRPSNEGVVRHGIVVGADATAESRVVLEYAYRQAALRDLPLTVLHSLWDAAALASAAHLIGGTTTDYDEERAMLAESMAGLGEKYPEVTVRTELARGLPQEALVAMADRMNLVVVGAHQRRPAERMLFGSVSVGVVEHAICPVAVVPIGQEEDARRRAR